MRLYHSILIAVFSSALSVILFAGYFEYSHQYHCKQIIEMLYIAHDDMRLTTSQYQDVNTETLIACPEFYNKKFGGY